MEESSLGMNGKEGFEVHRLLDHRKKQAFDLHVTDTNSRKYIKSLYNQRSYKIHTLTRSHAQKKIALSAYGRNTCRWRDSARPRTLLQQ